MKEKKTIIKNFKQHLYESETPFGVESGQFPGSDIDPNYRHIAVAYSPYSLEDAMSQGLAPGRMISNIPVDNSSSTMEEFLSHQPKTSFWNTALGRQMLTSNGWIWRCFAYDIYWNNQTYLRQAFQGIIYLTGSLSNMQRQIANYYAQTFFNNMAQYPNSTMPAFIYNRIAKYL